MQSIQHQRRIAKSFNVGVLEKGGEIKCPKSNQVSRVEIYWILVISRIKIVYNVLVSQVKFDWYWYMIVALWKPDRVFPSRWMGQKILLSPLSHLSPHTNCWLWRNDVFEFFLTVSWQINLLKSKKQKWSVNIIRVETEWYCMKVMIPQ